MQQLWLTNVRGINENGDYYLEILDTIFMFDEIAMVNGSLLEASLTFNCSTCTSACRNTIHDISTTFGCCANVFNNSVTEVQFPLLSYNAWNSCGIPTLSFCKSTLNLTQSGSTSIIDFVMPCVAFLLSFVAFFTSKL